MSVIFTLVLCLLTPGARADEPPALVRSAQSGRWSTHQAFRADWPPASWRRSRSTGQPKPQAAGAELREAFCPRED